MARFFAARSPATYCVRWKAIGPRRQADIRVDVARGRHAAPPVPCCRTRARTRRRRLPDRGARSSNGCQSLQAPPSKRQQLRLPSLSMPLLRQKEASADRRALRVGRARPSEGDIAAASAGANRLTDTLVTIEPATTLGSSGAATTLVAAAVQRTITGDPVVVAEDGSSYLAAFARLGALPAEPDGPAITARGSADTVRAEQTTAADGVSIARAAIVVAAVQDAVGVDPVRCADRGSR